MKTRYGTKNLIRQSIWRLRPDLQGVKILEWQQQSLLESLWLIIFPD